MARKKKPEGETQEQAEQRVQFERIANRPNRSEKVSWQRKEDNLVKLLAQLQPIEDEIFDIIIQKKQPLLDEVQELREMMVNECIHPFEHLTVNKDGNVECKFCYRELGFVEGD